MALCSHPEGHGQAGWRKDRQYPHEVQHEEVQSTTAGEEQPQVLGLTGNIQLENEGS